MDTIGEHLFEEWVWGWCSQNSIANCDEEIIVSSFFSQPPLNIKTKISGVNFLSYFSSISNVALKQRYSQNKSFRKRVCMPASC